MSDDLDRLNDFVRVLDADLKYESVLVREEHLAEETQRHIEKQQQARREASRPDPNQSLERMVLWGSRPRRKRWRELSRFDEEHDALLQRQAEAVRRLGEAEVALERAPQDDAAAFARWLAGDEKGEKPRSSLQDRTVERDGCRAYADGIQLEIDKLLQRRVDHVESNRRKMVDDARKDVEAARAKYDELTRALPAARDALIEAREVLVWAAVFPEPVHPFGNPANVGLGLAAVMKETLGTNAQIEFNRVLALLDRDAQALADEVSGQAKLALGTAGPRVPTREAMWDDDPDMVQWKEVEKQRARMLAEHDFRDPHELAAEIRE